MQSTAPYEPGSITGHPQYLVLERLEFTYMANRSDSPYGRVRYHRSDHGFVNSYLTCGIELASSVHVREDDPRHLHSRSMTYMCPTVDSGIQCYP
ncbi:hypothetical protein Trydic_g7213 [Trypoxylus dichotomus]